MPTAMDWPTNESSPQPPKAPPAPGRYCPGRKVAGSISSEGADRRGQGQGAGGHDRSTRSAHPRRPVVSVVAANPSRGLNTKDITWTVQNTANWQALFDHQKHRGTRHVITPPPASGTGQVPPSALVQPNCSGNLRGPPTSVVKWSCALPNCWKPAARLTSLETLASMAASGCAFRNDLMPPRSMR